MSECLSGGHAVHDVPRQTPLDKVLGFVRDVAPVPRRVDDLRPPRFLLQLVRVLREEGRPTAEHGVEDDAEGPHVGRPTAAPAVEQLGRAIPGATGVAGDVVERIGGDARGEAEIGEGKVVKVAVDGAVEDVLGLDVAVDDAACVKVGDSREEGASGSPGVGFAEVVALDLSTTSAAGRAKGRTLAQCDRRAPCPRAARRRDSSACAS
jgi:hypothetical protein